MADSDLEVASRNDDLDLLRHDLLETMDYKIGEVNGKMDSIHATLKSLLEANQRTSSINNRPMLENDNVNVSGPSRCRTQTRSTGKRKRI